jgi:hypothetical protein
MGLRYGLYGYSLRLPVQLQRDKLDFLLAIKDDS